MSISTDPEYNLAAPSVTDPQYPSYLDATNIVNAIAAGTDSDLTNGALYYANLKESTSGWFFRHIVNDPANHPLRATLGHQVCSTPKWLCTSENHSNSLLCFGIGKP